MKALILNGTRKQDPEIEDLYNHLIDELRDSGWEVTSLILKDIKISHCLGCFECWIKTPGECVINDYSREITKLAIQSDLLLFFTPVTFGGYSSELKKAVDRLIPNLLPFFKKVEGEIHHVQRYEKRFSLLVVGYLNYGNDEKMQIFKTLVDRNALNMAPPFHDTHIFIKGQDPSEFYKNFKLSLKSVEGMS
ncbi:MAG: flavodoxin family protein [Promethearchaeota archaeon]